jgi:amino acid adenylation domain-containing protein
VPLLKRLTFSDAKDVNQCPRIQEPQDRAKRALRPTIGPLIREGSEVDTLAAAVEPAIRYPLSAEQDQFWRAEQQHPRSSALRIVARLRIDGDYSDETFEKTWQYLVARHAALRTRIEHNEGKPIQVVEPQTDFSVVFVDLRALAQSAAESDAEQIAGEQASLPFDLGVAPLLRVCRIAMNDQRSTVVIAAHRIICDERSLEILAREMSVIAAAFERGEAVALADPPTTYARTCEVQPDHLGEMSSPMDVASLRKSLRDFKQLELAADRPRSAMHKLNTAIVSRLIEPSRADALMELALDAACSFECVLLAAILTLLHRYSGETDIGIGMEVSSRDDAQFDEIVGCFVATVPLRVDVSADPSFKQLLERARAAMAGTSSLRRIPLDGLTDISVNVGFDRKSVSNAVHPEAAAVLVAPPSTGSRFDLNFRMTEAAGTWCLACEYNTDLYDSATAADLLDRLDFLLGSVLENPELSLSRLPILTGAERHELVVDLNQTQAAYPSDRIVPDLFSAQALRTPNAVAVICGDEQLTYAELDAASNRLARELMRRDLGPGKRIGILLERSADLVVALLAVFKAGSAYVPLDPGYPTERLAFIVDDTRLAGVISTSSMRGCVQADLLFLQLDTQAREIAANSGGPLETRAGPNDLAYMIYTSGSTGKPKGVQIEHRALVNVLYAMWKSPGITATDVLVATTTISFDVAAVDMFLPLIVGARLVIALTSEAADGNELLRLLRRSDATIMQAAHITWQLLLEAGWTGNPALKILCGGEPLSRNLADTLLACGGELWNMYGPTETTVCCSALRVQPGTGPVLLGPPIANTQFYVLDAHGELVPPGVAGELHIGGDGVARGYFDRDDLTRERFVPDRFRGIAGAKLYRTGDIVRRRGCATLEFIGRRDQQIKLRGFRIELGEIEATLQQQPHVLEAAAVIREGLTGEKAIWAFVVPAADARDPANTFIADLRFGVSKSLPYYMVPSRIVALDSLPRTPNGKVDRRALQKPIDVGAPKLGKPSWTLSQTNDERERSLSVDPTGLATPEGVLPSTDDFSAPRTPTELLLAQIWAETLRLEHVSRSDQLFALGADSLQIFRIVARAKKRGLHLTAKALHLHPTIAALASYLDETLRGARDDAAVPGGTVLRASASHVDAVPNRGA